MLEISQITPEKLDQLPPKKRALAIAIARELHRRRTNRTVFGLVDPEKGLTHCLKKVDDKWQRTEEPADIYLPAKMERVLLTKARQIYIYGGRGSGKSISAGDIVLADAKDDNAKAFCLREYQTSIADSVHALLVSEIDRLEIHGFECTKSTISKDGVDMFSYRGIARDPSGIKSAFGFLTWLVEEAQFLSEDSLSILLPSARKKPNKGLPMTAAEVEEVDMSGVRVIMIANLGSMQDPLSKRLLPYQDHVEKHGYYEDDLRLIIKMNYTDNPWFAESGMEAERADDEKNMPRALYNHIWLGDYNDHVENALIMSEWFDACVDAHLKLGWEPKGVRAASHDPSDHGPDEKGYCARHGSLVFRVEESDEGGVEEGIDWACELALEDRVDYFTWDSNGMGAGRARQIAGHLDGKKIDVAGFLSQEGPDFPNQVYKPARKEYVRDEPKVSDVFKNLSDQYAFELRDRIYRTYQAVTDPDRHGYQDPDTLISFSSTMPLLGKLRAQVCRVPREPVKGNGFLQLMAKEKMKRLYKVNSPNLFDALKMLMRYRPPQRIPDAGLRPAMIQPIRRRS